MAFWGSIQLVVSGGAAREEGTGCEYRRRRGQQDYGGVSQSKYDHLPRT